MIKIIIQDKDGKEEVMEMPQDAWNRILKLAEEHGHKTSQKDRNTKLKLNKGKD